MSQVQCRIITAEIDDRCHGKYALYLVNLLALPARGFGRPQKG
jgi:hypothetical protein